jgi:hypothetical protein
MSSYYIDDLYGTSRLSSQMIASKLVDEQSVFRNLGPGSDSFFSSSQV